MNICICSEGSLLCQVSNILATGLMQPWYPVSASKTSISGSPNKKADGKKDKTAVKVVPKVTTGGFDPDAIAELKQALEVCSPDRNEICFPAVSSQNNVVSRFSY